MAPIYAATVRERAVRGGGLMKNCCIIRRTCTEACLMSEINGHAFSAVILLCLQFLSVIEPWNCTFWADACSFKVVVPSVLLAPSPHSFVFFHLACCDARTAFISSEDVFTVRDGADIPDVVANGLYIHVLLCVAFLSFSLRIKCIKCVAYIQTLLHRTIIMHL